MKKVYFISDVHLGAHPPRLEQAKIDKLVSFLSHIQKDAQRLYIVGDLYDHWFEYRKAIPKVNLKVLFTIQQLAEAGVEVIYFTGNHDQWLGDYLEGELDVTICREPLCAEHNHLKLYIAHGDGLIKRDMRVRILNRIFRNRVNMLFYRWLHPDLGLPFMKYIAAKSRQKSENAFDDEYFAFAKSKLEEGFDGVILGHTHKPLFREINSKHYINLGDWCYYFTYLVLTGTAFELKTWSGDSTD
ncbi:MAG: UDP-2,3-diacylglucosamine diphosphatase [bacterium]